MCFLLMCVLFVCIDSVYDIVIIIYGTVHIYVIKRKKDWGEIIAKSNKSVHKSRNKISTASLVFVLYFCAVLFYSASSDDEIGAEETR